MAMDGLWKAVCFRAYLRYNLTMHTALWIILISLWVSWCAQAILSVLLVRKFARRLTRTPREVYETYRPKAVVIVPFKGIEPGIEEHIQRLAEQSYPDYRLVFIVQSEDDAAHDLLQQAARSSARVCDIVIAGDAPPTVGQKVHNHLRALEFIKNQQWNERVWVFADSDAAPGSDWLGNLVGPLHDKRTGVTTGYRWLIPDCPPPLQGGATIWSHFASIINSSRYNQDNH
ncbi:MAG: glycosyltransferase [Firmicutes bacterium]|nr:glycosyltransferase [Bacillota bacterium]